MEKKHTVFIVLQSRLHLIKALKNYCKHEHVRLGNEKSYFESYVVYLLGQTHFYFDNTLCRFRRPNVCHEHNCKEV